MPKPTYHWPELFSSPALKFWMIGTGWRVAFRMWKVVNGRSQSFHGHLHGLNVDHNHLDHRAKIIGNGWVHVAMVYSRSQNRMSLWFNGKEIIILRPSNPQWGTTLEEYGKIKVGDTRPSLLTRVSRLGFWSRALSSSEIQARAKGSCVSESGLVAFYPLNGDLNERKGAAGALTPQRPVHSSGATCSSLHAMVALLGRFPQV